MNELPILFQTDMVRAVIDLIKNQTRRLTNLETVNEDPEKWELAGIGEYPLEDGKRIGGRLYAYFKIKGTDTWADPILCPYGKPGDLLYVREAFAEIGYKHWQKYHGYAFKSDFGDGPVDWRWKPSIHMPKKAARIWLKVKDVRVERVQDISTEDIKAEGVQVPVSDNGRPLISLTDKYQIATYMPDDVSKWTEDDFWTAHFAKLWDSINKKRGYSFESNPWLWCVDFEVVSTNGKPENDA